MRIPVRTACQRQYVNAIVSSIRQAKAAIGSVSVWRSSLIPHSSFSRSLSSAKAGGAGIHFAGPSTVLELVQRDFYCWIPAFAGMTAGKVRKHQTETPPSDHGACRL